jgi:hypothetical protein
MFHAKWTIPGNLYLIEVFEILKMRVYVRKSIYRLTYPGKTPRDSDYLRVSVNITYTMTLSTDRLSFFQELNDE